MFSTLSEYTKWYKTNIESQKNVEIGLPLQMENI